MNPPVGDPIDVRAQVLDAAERCLRREGVRRTRMVDIAAEAGISRAWLYRQFPDKASVVQAVIVRNDEAFWARADERIGQVEGLPAKVTEAILLSRSQQPSALLRQLAESDPGATETLFGGGLEDLMPGLGSFWHQHVAAAKERGEVRPDLDVERAADWLLRIVVSLVAIPGGTVDTGDPVTLRAYLDDFLLAGLGPTP